MGLHPAECILQFGVYVGLDHLHDLGGTETRSEQRCHLAPEFLQLGVLLEVSDRVVKPIVDSQVAVRVRHREGGGHVRLAAAAWADPPGGGVVHARAERGALRRVGRHGQPLEELRDYPMGGLDACRGRAERLDAVGERRRSDGHVRRELHSSRGELIEPPHQRHDPNQEQERAEGPSLVDP
ncbi:hypothetical protein ON010_g12922 [Phytophthora cinnamomi]|nr:hypothetical protein ON010_g12922 [Phytophthora cinnamomi]